MITNISQINGPELSLSFKPLKEQKNSNDIQFNQLVHDLKSPVNSLKGIVELAHTQINDEQAKEYFFMINRCVDKLEQKISNTLNMFQHGSDMANLDEIDFNELLEEIKISLSHIEGINEVNFSINIDTLKPFYSSQPILESILQNLIENAVKYRCSEKDSCSVMISISDSDNGIQIKVMDDGIGIEKEKLPHIFEANFRALMSGEGSHGLGLYIVKKAVEKIHGTIEVRSSVGVGTTFTLDLPNACDASTYVGAGELCVHV